MAFGLTDAGFTAPRTANFLQTIQDDYESRTGLSIDWEHDTFLGNITALMAFMLNIEAESSQALYDSFDVGNAQGIQLDNFMVAVGLRRLDAVASQATVTLSGVAGTLIGAGKRVRGGGTDDKALWSTSADATIGGGGTVDVVVVAVEKGATVALATEIGEIVTPVSGWTGVTNAANATTGRDIETDADARLRRAQSLAASGGRSKNALLADLLEEDGVVAAVVLDNPDGDTNVVEGIVMAPHSTAIIVHPNTLTDAQKKSVTETIFRQVPSGTFTNGSDVVATVTKADGFLETIRWDFATTLTVNVVTTVVLDTGFVLGDVSQAVIDAVVAHFATLSVGDAVRLLDLSVAVGAIAGITGATFTLNGLAVDVVPLITEIPVLGTNTVTT